jgi:RNA polymerase sigma-70 factor (ECF subfamily)
MRLLECIPGTNETLADSKQEPAAHSRKETMTPLDPPSPQATAADATAEVAALAARASRGERAAFEQIIERFQADIFRMVYYRTRSRMDAEDLTQEIFMQAYRQVNRLQDPERLRAWLFAIAANRVRDFLRRKRLLAFFGTAAEDGPPDVPDRQVHADPGSLDQLIQQEFWTELERLAAQLSHWEREVFFLRFLDQLSLREIAEVLKKSESAVKTHLYRALEKFKGNRELIGLLRGVSP